MSHINVSLTPFGDETIELTYKARPEDFEVFEVPLRSDQASCNLNVDTKGSIDFTFLSKIIQNSVLMQKSGDYWNKKATQGDNHGYALLDQGEGATGAPCLDPANFLGDTFVDKIQEMQERFIMSLSDTSVRIPEPLVLDFPATMNKAERQAIHKHIHEKFPLVATSKAKDSKYEISIDTNLQALLRANCPLGDANRLSIFLQRQQGQSVYYEVIQIGQGLSREQRTTLHRALAQHYPRLQARTMNVPNSDIEQAIEVRIKPRKKRKADDRISHGGIRGQVNMHLHFSVVKQNMDHFSAQDRLAVAAQVNSASVVAYAGMKDKRAVTCQRMSIPLPSVVYDLPVDDKEESCLTLRCKEVASREALAILDHFASEQHLVTKDAAGMSRRLYDHGYDTGDKELKPALKIGDFTVEGKALQLGELRQNHFRLFLRGIGLQSSLTLLQHLDKASTLGFPNYFGSQRFTTSYSGGTEPEQEPNSAVLGKHLLRGELRELTMALLQQAASRRDDLSNMLETLLSDKPFAEVLDAVPTSFPVHALERSFLRNLVRYGAENISPPPLEATDKLDGYLRAYSLAIKHIPYTQRNLWTSVHQSWVWNRAVSDRLTKSGFPQAPFFPVEGDLVLRDGERGKVMEENDEVEVITASMLNKSSHEELLELSFRVVYPLYGSRVIMPRHALGTQYAAAMANQSTVGNSRWGKLPSGAYRTVLSRVIMPSFCILERESCCELQFALPPGAYATSLLSHLCGKEEYL